NDIVSDPTRCARIVPAGAADSALINDLASTTTASNYMWLTPNKCNDMHSCPIGTGDAYLADLVQRILSSPVFTSERAALLITFDLPSNMSNVLSPLTVTGTAFDNIAIRTVELRTDGSPFAKIATGTTSWTVFLTLATGNHTIDARVTDFSGNQNTSEISV